VPRVLSLIYLYVSKKCHRDADVYDDEANDAAFIHGRQRKLERGGGVGEKSFRANTRPCICMTI
jgi:hypothetical protein